MGARFPRGREKDPVTAPALDLVGISKNFGPVRANRDVTLSITAGTIHGIVGENGAGKSTLMSIVYGFYEADAGEIRVKGQTVRIASSKDSIRHGIGMVHQHFMLVDTLSVLDNVMLGAEGGAFLRAGARRTRARMAELARDYGLAIDPDALVGELGVGLQQRVEIVKALLRGAEVLILDEPTAVLTPGEADGLFAMLRTLRARGVTVVLITHKLREIMAVTDRVSVMRRGTIVETVDTAATSPARLADAMVGRRVSLTVARPPSRPGPPRLEARNLTAIDAQGVTVLNDVSFTLRAGEIAGLAGVAGNGQVRTPGSPGRHPGADLRRGADRRPRRAARRAQPPRARASRPRPRARRTGTAWGWSRRSRRPRAPSSASTASPASVGAPSSDAARFCATWPARWPITTCGRRRRG